MNFEICNEFHRFSKRQILILIKTEITEQWDQQFGILNPKIHHESDINYFVFVSKLYGRPLWY